MIQLADNKSCTGCACCYNICSHNAISMQEDSKDFFNQSLTEINVWNAVCVCKGVLN